MGNKVTFHPDTRIIQVTQAPTYVNGEWVVNLDINTDVYSDGKEDWENDPDLNKLIFPVRYVGGDPISDVKELGVTFFLKDGWRIRPYEANHVFRVNGNLYTDEGVSPFVSTVGSYNILLTQQVSDLVDSTIQQLPEIEYASFGGGVTVDVIGGYPGTQYQGKPVGTQLQPSNNMADALEIATTRGLPSFYILGDITLDNSLDFTQYTFYGESPNKSTITVASDAVVDKCEFYECTLTGTLDGNCKAKNCVIHNLNYISGYIELCVLQGTTQLGGGATAYFLDCWAGTNSDAPPVIDLGGSGQTLVMQNFNGYIKWQNKNGNEQANVSLNAGWIEIDSTVTNGSGTVIGVGTVTDNSGPGFVLDQSRLLSPESVSTAVWTASDPSFLIKTIKNKKSLVKNGSVWQLIIYDDDNSTPILTKDLKDKNGSDITDLAAGVLAQELKSSV